MLKILINEPDVMFNLGIKFFINDFFRQSFGRQATFLIEYNSENIAEADVIILSMCNGERYTCFPELRARRKGIIIGLVDENDEQKKSPTCFEDIIYVTRRESLGDFSQKLYVAWHKWIMNGVFPQHQSCLGCRQQTLSLQQRDIMIGLHQGNTVKEIAELLHINYKTVATHKYCVMRKFCLKNDHDLFRFLRMLSKKSESRFFL